MLNECRKALRITTEAYDGELCSLMEAGAADLRTAGVRIPGSVAFNETVTTAGTSTWNDTSSLNDRLVQRAIFTYVRMMFGSPEDYDRVHDSYEAQKGTLMHAADYTGYDESGDC